MRILFFLVLLELHYAFPNELRLDEDELAEYFGLSTKDTGIVPEYEIVYIDHVTSAKTARHVTRDSIVEETASFKFRVFDEDFHVAVTKETGLFPEQTPDCVYLDENGTPTTESIPTNCFYRGTLQGDMKSMVSISTCTGITGTITRNGHDTLYIEPLRNAHATKRGMNSQLGHVVYKALKDEVWECGVEDDVGYQYHQDDVTVEQIAPKYLKLHMVAEHQYWAANGAESCTCLTASFHTLARRMALLPNLNLLLARITIMKSNKTLDTNLISINNLDLIRTWVDQHPEKAAWDHVALIVPRYMDVGGRAWLCGTCGYNKVSVSYLGSLYGMKTIAHEMGHNLCIGHTNGGRGCGLHGYVMGAIAGWHTQEMGWSQCSLNTYFAKINTFSCLNDS